MWSRHLQSSRMATMQQSYKDMENPREIRRIVAGLVSFHQNKKGHLE